jgi:drug/metabolite transporter (DMT)-like permease
MSWLLLAILARFFWACCNMTDQFLTRFTGNTSVIGIMIAESLVFFPIAALIAFVSGVPLALTTHSMLWLSLGVVVNMACVFPYLLALKHDEAHNVIPFFEFVPVFVTLLAWVLFDDKMTGTQLCGAALVVAGGFLFSWNFEHGHFHVRTLLLMGLSSILFAVYLLILRFGVQNESPWSIMMFVFMGFFISALLLFAAVPVGRRSFLQSLRVSKGAVLLVALGEESMAFLANVCIAIAMIKAPKAGQVAALSGIQPFFILLISMVLGALLPRYYAGLVWSREMKIKCLLLTVMAAGIVLVAK